MAKDPKKSGKSVAQVAGRYGSGKTHRMALLAVGAALMRSRRRRLLLETGIASR